MRGVIGSPGWAEVAADLDALLAEQAAAHAGATSRFEEVFAAAARFAEPLAQAIEVRRDVPVTIDDSGRPATFAGYGGELGDAPWDLVRVLLGDRAEAEARARAHLAAGGDVFGAFEGRWRGAWYAQSPTGAPYPATLYDHDWGPTGPAGDLLVQRVVMGPWAGAPAGVPAAVHTPAGVPAAVHTPAQGIYSTAPEAAINAVAPATGRITGGVGVDAGRTRRPHAGFFVDERTLLWVAREGAPEGLGDATAACYSCFFEHRTGDGRYVIMGIQFAWGDGGGAEGGLDVRLLMGGVYERPRSS
jgi:hypothetical protein